MQVSKLFIRSGLVLSMLGARSFLRTQFFCADVTQHLRALMSRRWRRLVFAERSQRGRMNSALQLQRFPITGELQIAAPDLLSGSNRPDCAFPVDGARSH